MFVSVLGVFQVPSQQTTSLRAISEPPRVTLLQVVAGRVPPSRNRRGRRQTATDTLAPSSRETTINKLRAVKRSATTITTSQKKKKASAKEAVVSINYIPNDPLA